MRSESQGRIVYIACFVIVLVVVVAVIFYIATTPGPPAPASLPIPAGTVIRPPYLVVEFTVEGGPANLVGAWRSEDGGYVWVNDVSRSNGLFTPLCGPPTRWNGTLLEGLLPGSYLVVFAPHPNGTILITQAVALVHPWAGWSTEEAIIAGGCTPAGFSRLPFAVQG